MSDTLLSVPARARVMFRCESGRKRLYAGASFAAGLGLREEFLSSRGFSDPTARFLVELDRKVDAVLSLLRQNAMQKVFPHEGRVLRLGVREFSLSCAHTLAEGQELEMLIFLGDAQERIISALVKVDKEVTACLPDDTREDGALPTGERQYELSFLDMDEEDREGLIRSVFAEERRRIRRSRFPEG
ncbi:MAG: hypothetical protein LBS65_02625 [Desulfovibrio sp.]|jgi:hypothetical protein|nr:hypothetical protein [Desulfovibrio sp.]